MYWVAIQSVVLKKNLTANILILAPREPL